MVVILDLNTLTRVEKERENKNRNILDSIWKIITLNKKKNKEMHYQ